ncbi:MAG: hypothetical protein JXX14_16420 [Deltaproteobacteria bacterium]|nr:hypothetical protein [Deltaproteobacteria bacterium]
MSKIGVDYTTQVKVIVATHWDDDHIRGLGDIAGLCENADFFMSAALNDKRFNRIVLDSPLSTAMKLDQKVNTGINEFHTVYHALKARRKTPEYALDNKLLWRSPMSSQATVTALSPHSSAMDMAMQSILSLVPRDGTPIGNIKAPKPNYTSVVLWISINNTCLLLGADMEESPEFPGWSLISADMRSRYSKAEVYKVAHHGSATGEHPQIWSDMLVQNPCCVIAPWQRGGRKLPTPNDLKRIRSKSDNVHLSHDRNPPGSVKKNRIKHRDRSMLKIKAKPLFQAFSMVRCRKKISFPASWNVEHFGNATPVL